MFVNRTSVPARRVTLAEAKAQLNVLSTRDDAYITTLIDAAEESIMSRTNTVFSNATFVITYDEVCGKVRFPIYPVYNSVASPITSVVGVKEQGDAEVALVEDTDWYYTDNGIFLMNNESYHKIVVTTPAGFTNEDFPQNLKSATLMLIGSLYANRQSEVASVVTKLPYGIEFLADKESYDYFA